MYYCLQISPFKTATCCFLSATLFQFGSGTTQMRLFFLFNFLCFLVFYSKLLAVGMLHESSPAQVEVPEKGVNLHDATLAGIEHFSKDKLATTEVPDKGVNTHDATLAGVTNFNKVRRHNHHIHNFGHYANLGSHSREQAPQNTTKLPLKWCLKPPTCCPMLQIFRG